MPPRPPARRSSSSMSYSRASSTNRNMSSTQRRTSSSSTIRTTRVTTPTTRPSVSSRSAPSMHSTTSFQKPKTASSPQKTVAPSKPINSGLTRPHARHISAPPANRMKPVKRNPIRYRTHEHTFVFYPEPIYDMIAGIEYDCGYYDENGVFYETLPAEQLACEYCGSIVPADSCNCPNCGASLILSGDNFRYIEPEEIPVIQHKKKNTGVLIAILIAVAVIAVAVIKNNL